MNQNVKVTSVPTDNERFAGALGISKEREEQIDEIMDKCHAETDTYPDAIAMLSDSLNNANELAYACFYFGAFAEQQRNKLEIIQEIFGK